MNLSKRLQAVATLVDVGVRVIDVGCDHAYLDIYLTINNDNECLATDINKNALENAKRNIKKYDLQNKIQTLLTNGLVDVDVNSDDTVIMSGMGTYTILNILNSGKLSDTLIISSNNDVVKLREEVIKLGYIIESEIFLYDKGKPYIVIKFIKGFKKYSKRDILYGPILKNNIEYRRYLINKYTKIMKSISCKKLLLKIKYKFRILALRYLK